MVTLLWKMTSVEKMGRTTFESLSAGLQSHALDLKALLLGKRPKDRGGRDDKDV